ncbi:MULTISPECIES: pantetheine-phosphate adenylyltransferase [Pasteurellaceae]|uniref:Phosphopantetheine adenylyltransferase n=1 Tax=Pasteurella atlantica TaxID=2827233 RepID=A0AAW8CK33_9PAST|nr:pantetheine-phosphate adenylyltransferase [Pasteurella atlantica]MBR0574498.1 pantetheine-phosphate adenylyltransferase [Pasteurella atlantica]MDP8040363.1 pantetheine-phosphate adenylyltransferase [Pasteurella atlantica]MDP8042414.1 pantetheine-phosphate adenylyltransferase [Pasteurella atlantica]MDP8044633.1 pantetheine-phosphate adenylyltransferase [Pasteurella atlantica]MDP8046684.1 pantetheine-phosphate adenylyltransferase [Pasteurella atlantica]
MKVIYAGTFDPITNGHLDQIERASRLFSKIIIAIAKNPTKEPLFELEQRVHLVQQSIKHLSNVEVIGFDGLLVELAQKHQAKALLRGIRNSNDVEYEIQLAQLNEKLLPKLETIFFPPSVEWRYLSSTQVREIYYHKGDVSQFVPDVVNQVLLNL